MRAHREFAILTWFTNNMSKTCLYLDGNAHEHFIDNDVKIKHGTIHQESVGDFVCVFRQEKGTKSNCEQSIGNLVWQKIYSEMSMVYSWINFGCGLNGNDANSTNAHEIFAWNAWGGFDRLRYVGCVYLRLCVVAQARYLMKWNYLFMHHYIFSHTVQWIQLNVNVIHW